MPGLGEYYTTVRKEIIPLLPSNVSKVLEIGCGTGQTLRWLKDHRGAEWIGGVELFHEAALQARDQLDTLIEGNIEQMRLPFEENSIDLILCLDVLEHLIDPWKIVSYLQTLIRPGGAMIICVPNVKYHDVVLPLMFKGEWNYTQAGVLDRTHLRFFVKETAVQMLEYAGLVVDGMATVGLERNTRKSQIFLSMLPESIRSFLVRQYLFRAVKRPIAH